MIEELDPAVTAERDDLIDRLRAHDIRYLSGGSVWSGQPPYASSGDVPVAPLLARLAQQNDGRLQSAIVALLFRHPSYAAEAEAALEALPDGSRDRLILVASLVAAAALQRQWAFSFDIYLPGWQPIDAAPLAARLSVPSPEDDYGRAALNALEALLQTGQSFPVAYRAAWEDVARHVLYELREESACAAA